MRWDWSPRGRIRVYALTALGTLVCICFAFTFDGFSLTTDRWHWGTDPFNDLMIPLIVAPPFFFFLLSKLRELAIAHHELMTVASTDSLTALLNRRAFTSMVDGYLDRVLRDAGGCAGALLVVDVDHFKAVNDRFGHDLGDEALKLIARTIRAAVRDIDLVGRLGGEEFCVFLPELDSDRSVRVAERIRRSIDEAPFVAANERHHLSVSVGGATFVDKVDFGSLYRCADQWLYFAKESGRNRVEVHKFGAAGPGHAMASYALN